jgi:HSP20 family molecular chaperone IbpA
MMTMKKTPTHLAAITVVVVIVLQTSALPYTVAQIIDGEEENEQPMMSLFTHPSSLLSSISSSSSSWERPTYSLFSDFFSQQDDFFDRIFPTHLHTMFFADQDGDDPLSNRHNFLRSPFDEFFGSVGLEQDHTGMLLAPPPPLRHSFLRGSPDLFASTLQPTDVRIIDDDGEFQVSMLLPKEIHVQDLNIHLEDGGTRLVIDGKHSSGPTSNVDDNVGVAKTTNAMAESSTTIQSFSQSFSVDPRTVEVDQFIATFKDGRLTISAPKDTRKIKNINHPIPVQNLDVVVPLLPTTTAKADVTTTETTSSNFVKHKSSHRHHQPIEELSHPFVSAKNALVHKRNQQMSKFTKLDPEGNNDDDDQLEHEHSKSHRYKDKRTKETTPPIHDPNSLITNNNSWRDVSATML